MRILSGIVIIFFAWQPLNAFADYAFSLYGHPKYPATFTHFSYVNPDAPKQGTIYLANPDRRTNFDKFNPFSLKGVSAAGVSDLMFESLATQSQDEMATMYGLLADDMVLAPDHLSMTFHLNPKAKFNDNTPVTAADVQYSFDTLMSKGSPQFKSVFAEIKRVVAVSPSLVRFEFASTNHELPLIAGAMPVFSKAWAKGTPFDQIQLTPPVSSGPYLIEKFQVGRSITFIRNPNYWGSQVPVRRGMYNFQRIVYRFYQDDVARLEAFKAGEFDMIVEMSSKNWVRNYIGKRFDQGTLIKQVFPNSNGAGMQGFIMNLRRPLFQDIRVRQAMILALDYEWLNRQLFYNQYQRISSYFMNTPLAAKDKPTAAEVTLLNQLKQQGYSVPDTLYQTVPALPTTTPPHSLRDNLLKARALLKEAGWTYRDGALRNAQGDVLEFEILDDQSALSRVISVYIRNLEKLGIRVRQRTADYALVAQRMEVFDFDMTSVRFSDTVIPGNELFDMYGSEAAKTNGSSNVWGLQNPLIDQLIKQLVQVKEWDHLLTVAHVLDRALLNQAMTVPHWYSSVHRVAFNRRLGMPSHLPLYYQMNSFVLSTWWEKTPS